MTRITLLSTSHCPLCDHARDVLDAVGRDHELEVETVPIESEKGAQLALDGGMLFPPGVLIDGAPFSHGRLSEGRLRRELDRRRAGSGS